MEQKTKSRLECVFMVGFVVLALVAVTADLVHGFKKSTEVTHINAEYKICVIDAGKNPDFLTVCQDERKKKLEKLKNGVSK